jgi:hypothetical protein
MSLIAVITDPAEVRTILYQDSTAGNITSIATLNALDENGYIE